MCRFFVSACLLFGYAQAADVKLTILNPTLHEGEDGPAIASDFEYLPGEVVYFSFRVSGYKKTGDEPDEKIDVAYEMNVRDSKGVLLDPPNVGSVGEKVSHQDKDWVPIVRYQFPLPGVLDTGEYKISVKLWDRFGNQETTAEKPFRVRSRAVEPSETLAVRNISFFRGEDDKKPLGVAAYRPGDAIWARFDMTGYKFGDGNEYAIEYGIAVARPDGSTSYSQPRAADEKSKSFYPQRYTSGVVNLTTPPDMAKGEYTLIISVKDAVSGQTCEARQKFTIE